LVTVPIVVIRSASYRAPVGKETEGTVKPMRFIHLIRRSLKPSHSRTNAFLVLLYSVFLLSAQHTSAASIELQGQSKGDTNTWTTGNLKNWVELDYIPARVFLSNPVTNQTITVYFPHFNGTTPGFQNLYSFTPSPNALITSGPTLATDPSGVWSYTFTVTVTNGSGYVQFKARLAAGAHFNTGSSLQLDGNPQSMGQLQIFKPGPGPTIPDLAIVKTGPATVKQGDTITYTLTYTNQANTTNMAIGAQISDILPAGVIINSNSLPATAEIIGNTIFFDLTNIAAHTGGQITFQVTVPVATGVGTVLTNFAQILSSEDDANLNNNVSRWITTVLSNCTPPAITNNPAGAVKCPGESVTFNVGASGTAPLRYQWRRNGTAISTATNSFYTINSVSSNDSGSYDVVVTNACGTATSTAAVLNATDTQNPVIQCPANILLDADISRCSRSNVTFAVTASDNCAVSSVVSIPASGSTFPVGTTTVTNTATDSSWNRSICTFTVTIRDTQAPVISCPGDVIVSANSGCSATNVNIGNATASDNCGVAFVTNNAPQVFVFGTHLVTWTAVDAIGNSSACVQRVIVRDTTAPVISCPANIRLAANPGQCSRSNVTFIVTATDNCSVTNLTSIPASGSTFPIGTTTVTNIATDASGNQSACAFIVTIVDEQPPIVQCPANHEIAADPGQCSKSNVTFTVIATDNCAVTNVTSIPASGSTFSVGTTTVTNIAVDASGNTSICTFHVVVRDAQKPVISCPTNIVVEADPGQCSKSNVVFTVTAADNCGVVNVTSIPPSGSTFPIGTTVVTNTARDFTNNAATCTFTVTVIDRQPPVVTCPSNIVVNADPGQCSKSNVTFNVSASDNCSLSGVISTPSNGGTFPIGTTTVTNVATDASGNQTICTFTVTVNDTENPVITCPTNIVVNADPGACSRSNVTFTVSANDNCSLAGIVSSRPSGSTFPVGTTTVTNTATDASGNHSVCTFKVTVNDVEPPVIACPANKVISVGQSWTFDKPTASDNCGEVIVSVISTITNAGCGNTFTASRTWRVTDTSGNFAECTKNVTIVDNVAPTVTILSPTNGTILSPPASFTIIATAEDANGAVSGVEFFIGTNSLGIVTNPSPNYSVSVTNLAEGDYTLTAIAVDACNNRGTSAPVNVRVQLAAPLVILTNLFLNRQSGYYEEVVRVFNPTAYPSNTVGVLVFGIQAPIVLVNQTALVNGVPYVQNGSIVPPGGFADIRLKFYVPLNVTNIEPPTLVAIVMPAVTTASVSGTPVEITRSVVLSDGSVLLNFKTVAGATYFVEYSEDMVNWKTSPQTVAGTGFTAQWIDDGPPATESFPPPAGSRFYRVVRVP
jgi:uncharacterized repeat protein (TIGR01451 family)